MQNLEQEQAENLEIPYEKPTAHVGFRLPPRILEEWKKAAGLKDKSLSDWLRAQIKALEIRMEDTKKRPRGKREIIRTYQDTDPVLIRELGRIGSNLNQIARQVNRAAMMGQTIQVVSFLLVLADMQHELRATLQSVREKHPVKRVVHQHKENGNVG